MAIHTSIQSVSWQSFSVLESLNELETEISKPEPNKAMVTLFVDNCGDKLCSLERKVDIAVLRMSLLVFTKYSVPLENIFNFCLEHASKQYDQEIIDNMVIDFDLHLDRIMQVGLFAVFCSTNSKSGIEIRNCLANLEYLEQELVPVILVLLKEDSEQNRMSASLLKEYWGSVVNDLKNLLFRIIDPFTFVQIICEEIGNDLDNLFNKKRNNEPFTKNDYESIIDYGGVLVDFMKVSLKNQEIEGETVKDRLQICCLVLREIRATVLLLDTTEPENNCRILKRCKLFKAEIQRLSLVLKSGMKMRIDGNINQSIQKCNDAIEDTRLEHIILRGKNMIENRSILYRTPHKTIEQYNGALGSSSKNISLSNTMKKLQLDEKKLNFSFNSKHSDKSFEINLTEILDNLSLTLNTF